MKMSDYFKLPVNYDIDICKVHAIGHNAIEAKVINLKVVCHAINNHDRLTEENKNLKDELESLEDDYKNEFNASEDLRCEKEDLAEENKRLSKQLTIITAQRDELITCLANVINEAEISYAVETGAYDDAINLLTTIKEQTND